jgi:phytoene dehydrogenase-like protein
MKQKALIIGSGIAGLCTGVYLRKNGFETEILEMNSIAGGLATAWKRDGYTFENCIHWLVGSREGEELNAIWKEVFDIGRLDFYDGEIYQVIDPETREDFLSFRVFHFDPTFAPAGKTAVVCFIPTYNHEYWVSLRARDKAAYDREKERVAHAVVGVCEARFPAAKGRIEEVDVATPATVVRYTGNWKGSMEGWLLTPATGFRQLPPVLPGLKGFYMAGQWLSPGGGLPSGLMTARIVSQRICRDHGVKWQAA